MNRTLITLFTCFALWAAHGCNSIPPADLDSGIEGQILAGPTCPVAMPGAECDDQPVVATVIVRSQAGLEVTRFTSDADGNFHVALFPGRYTLDPQPAGYISTPPSQTVDVQSMAFTQVVITYDTGIR